jgi:hypothetical protein
MTCSWRWFIHPETAISKKRNGSSTLCVFKTHYRDRRATVANHLIFIQIQFSDHKPSQIRTTLQQTAQDIGKPGFDQLFNFGLADAAAAVQAAAGR